MKTNKFKFILPLVLIAAVIALSFQNCGKLESEQLASSSEALTHKNIVYGKVNATPSASASVGATPQSSRTPNFAKKCCFCAYQNKGMEPFTADEMRSSCANDYPRDCGQVVELPFDGSPANIPWGSFADAKKWAKCTETQVVISHHSYSGYCDEELKGTVDFCHDIKGGVKVADNGCETMSNPADAWLRAQWYSAQLPADCKAEFSGNILSSNMCHPSFNTRLNLTMTAKCVTDQPGACNFGEQCHRSHQGSSVACSDSDGKWSNKACCTALPSDARINEGGVSSPVWVPGSFCPVPASCEDWSKVSCYIFSEMPKCLDIKGALVGTAGIPNPDNFTKQMYCCVAPGDYKGKFCLTPPPTTTTTTSTSTTTTTTTTTQVVIVRPSPTVKSSATPKKN